MGSAIEDYALRSTADRVIRGALATRGPRKRAAEAHETAQQGQCALAGGPQEPGRRSCRDLGILQAGDASRPLSSRPTVRAQNFAIQ